MLKALEEDPNVFEYDSLYEEMQEKKKKSDPRLAKKDKTVRELSCLPVGHVTYSLISCGPLSDVM